MNILIVSLLLILFAGIFQGSFGLGMKRFSPNWEAYWIVFSIIGMLLIPMIWGSIVIPDIPAAIAEVPAGRILSAMLLGLFWGITALMFGISIKYLGVSLAYGIAMGISAAFGSIVPLLGVPDFLTNPATPIIFVGIFVLLIGVYLITRAGQARERIQSDDIKAKALLQGGRYFKTGLLLAIISGVGAGILNVGFTNAAPVVQAAIDQGARPQNASLAAWIIVLTGGFLASLFYCVYLFIKNKSIHVFTRKKDLGRILKWSVFTAILWFAALGVYGQGAALMGEMGPVIGWTMLMALALIVSNFWGIYGGEWKGAKQPFRTLMIGNAVLLLSWIIMGYANSLL
jgi:L-rhamnose-H+ transport protein